MTSVFLDVSDIAVNLRSRCGGSCWGTFVDAVAALIGGCRLSGPDHRESIVGAGVDMVAELVPDARSAKHISDGAFHIRQVQLDVA